MQNIPLNTVRNVSVSLIHTENSSGGSIETVHVHVRTCSIVISFMF